MCMEGNTKRKQIVFLLLFLLLASWTGVLCFYHLGEAGTHNWDEARHIVNAYEMLKSKNWWISTYLYETDYFNYKPPLSMWCIMLSFHFFGFSSFTMRLYSAVSMMLLFILLVSFCTKQFGRKAAIIAAIMLVSGTDLFFFHMARSADADALYLFLLSAAMICLYKTEKNPWFLTGVGLFLSLAFMAKCLHMAVGVAVLICYLPRIYKKLKVKHYAVACGIAALPIGIWVIARYLYDGITFFAGMFGQEVAHRVTIGKDYFGYLRYFFTNPVIIIAVTVIFVDLLILRRTIKNISVKDLVWKFVYSDLYLFIVWLIIPLVVYSASGAFMEWYAYTCYLPFCVIVGVVLSKAAAVDGKRGYLAKALVFMPLIGLIISCEQSLDNLKTLKYTSNTDIRADLASLIEEHPECRGERIYIENSRNVYQPQNVWEQNCVADAYIQGDLMPIDGGVPLFVDDKEAILIISKDLFESYYNTLAGRVILVDGNDYLIFDNTFYE